MCSLRYLLILNVFGGGREALFILYLFVSQVSSLIKVRAKYSLRSHYSLIMLLLVVLFPQSKNPCKPLCLFSGWQGPASGDH